jgi:excisionase family DNA binding protein
MNDLMRVDEVASYARVHRESVLRWIRGGRLRAAKAGKEYRIDRADLLDFMGFPRKPGRPPGKKKAARTSQREPL